MSRNWKVNAQSLHAPARPKTPHWFSKYSLTHSHLTCAGVLSSLSILHLIDCIELMEKIVQEDDECSMEGSAVAIDFLKTLHVRSFRLDNCEKLLRILLRIILPNENEPGGAYDETIGAATHTAIKGRPFAAKAMATFSAILESFGRFVFETCLNAPRGFGVDIEGEDRLKRCLSCHESFAKLADRICGNEAEPKEEEKSNVKRHFSRVQFIGLCDTKDKEAIAEAKRLSELLWQYKKGAF